MALEKTNFSGGDNAASKNAEHEVKVRFAREFTDVGSITYSAPESLSSASSFQSLSSTLSTKSNSGIYADFIPQSPSQVPNDSYVNSNISGLEDLIAGCAEIHLNSDDDHSYRTLQNSEDFSQDQTFASATDQPANVSKNLSHNISLTNSQNAVVEVVDDNLTTCESMSAPINSTEVIDDEATFGTICIKEPVAIVESNRRNSFIRLETVQRSSSPNKSDLSSSDHQTNNNSVDDSDKIPLPSNIKISNFNSTTCLSSNKEITNVSKKEEPRLIENIPVDESSLPCNIQECNLNSTTCLSSNKEITNVSKKEEPRVIENIPVDESSLPCNIQECNLNSMTCLSSNKEITNVSKKEEPRLIENILVDESSLSCNIQECNLNLTVCLSPNKEVTNVSKEIENNSIGDVGEILVLRNIVESNLNSTMCLSPNKEVTNDTKKEESRSIENNVIDDIYEIPVSCSIEESNLNSTMCLSHNKEVTNDPKKEDSRSIENNVINDIDEILVSRIVEFNLNSTVCLSPNKEVTNVPKKEESRSIENNVIDDIDEISVSRSIEESNLNSTMCFSPNKEVANISQKEESRSIENNFIDKIPVSCSPENSSLNSMVCLLSNKEVANVFKKEESRSIENNFIDYIDKIPVPRNPEDSSLNSTMCLSPNREITHVSKKEESSSIENNFINDIDKISAPRNQEDSSLNSTMCLSPNKESTHVSKEEELNPIENNLAEIAKEELDTLNIEQPNFEELQSAAEQFANDVYKSSLQFSEENEPFINATSEIFQDPMSFDFLIKHGNSKTVNRLRAESLYVKFDPLVADTSISTQGNTQFIKEKQNDKNESIMNIDTPERTSVNFNTPKCNPAIAAIDRLLFYSPISTNMTPKINKLQEKETSTNQSAKESESDTPLIIDVNMNKELELVRSTVLQLEEKLEKQRKEYEAEIENQKNAFQEKINKLQTQIVQEIKSKSQMTVVIEEYEKSISRILTERERDRVNLEQEKAKLQEELQATNVHLNNTEAAFNDVHQKYERLKGFVSVYKSNETLLKESIRENLDTIKGLEMRYDQLKNHAKTELEKANYELDAIRKQHEDETTKLHALVRRAELKSNSLAELVDQKTKENKELTQILDEVIARVGHQSPE
ncbi:hypothetical protein E2986_10517 [Frieseomelitta varia]|uniref:Transforming acidic coiled-coil-containing protein C-terminal domain-containing protein n=1 Tax=Frieseomelitta varia TaxID=561572 RepID=A0A833S1B9_9HYME|nr:hypothetical protein E2986_10517 [Frieseomelitta varia]